MPASHTGQTRRQSENPGRGRRPQHQPGTRPGQTRGGNQNPGRGNRPRADREEGLFLPETTPGSLASMPIPSLNPFLVAGHLVKMKKKDGDIEEAKAVIARSDNVEIFEMNEEVPLRKAKEGQFFDMAAVNRHEDDVLRQCCAGLWARFHYLTEYMIARFAVPSRHPDHSSGREFGRTQVMKWASNFQTAVMTTYLKGLQMLVEEMGGLEPWRRVTSIERMTVFKRVWNTNKVRMAAVMLGPTASAVPIVDIFSGKTPEHTKWQVMHKTVFVWTCEKVFEHRVLADNRKAAYDFFKSMMKRHHFGPRQLNLGGIDDIPVKYGSVYDTDRRTRIEMENIEEDFGLCDTDGEEEDDDADSDEWEELED